MNARLRSLGLLTSATCALAVVVACQAAAIPSPSSTVPGSASPSGATMPPASASPAPASVAPPVSPHWEPAGETGELTLSHALPLSGGRVLILGEGLSVDGIQAPTQGALWDPATGAWTETEPLKHRSAFAAVGLADDRVLVTGGLNDEDPRQSFSSAWIFDARPGRQGWTKTGLMSTARTGPAAAILPDGRVLIAGGYFHVQPDFGQAPDAVLAAYHPAGGLFDVDMGVAGAALATAEVFDPATGQWSSTRPMTYARYGASAVPLADGRILVVGSLRSSEGYAVGVDPGAIDTAEIYDPATGRFTLAGELPAIDWEVLDAARGTSAAEIPTYAGEVLNAGTLVALPDGGAVLIGQTTWWKHAADVTRSFRFHADSASWSEIDEMWAYVEDYEGMQPLTTSGVRNVAGALAAGLPDGRVLVAGGGGSSPDGFGGRHASDVAELYDPRSDTWQALSPMPVGRSGGAAASLTDASIILAGGLADADEYIPETSAVRLVP